MRYIADRREIAGFSCYTYQGERHIRGYSANKYADFWLYGDKWVKTYERESSYSQDYSNYTCLDIENMPSEVATQVPFYVFIGVIMAVCSYVFIYKVMIKWIFKNAI